MSECYTCGEELIDDLPDEQCPKSKRRCGHHCNHARTSDSCHWCGWKVPTE